MPVIWRIVMKDLYDILKIGRDASSQEIKRAYRSLALGAHPDRQGDDSTGLMSELNNAYHTLIDDEQRQLFDQEWAQYQALNEEPVATSVDDYLTTNSERFSDKFARKHASLINQYQQVPLDRRQASSFVSTAKTWGGFERTTKNNPRFPEVVSGITVINIIKAIRVFLNQATSDSQVNAIKQALYAIPSSHQYKDIYHNAWKVLNNQFDVDVLQVFTKFAKDCSGELQEKLMLLFATSGWRAKATLAYSKALHPHNMSSVAAQDFLVKSLQEFDGKAQAASRLSLYRQHYIRFEGDAQERANLKSLINFLNLNQLYENATTLDPQQRYSAKTLREFSLASLDWLTAYSGKITKEGLVNFYLKAGYLFLLTSTHSQESASKMADEQLALQMLLSAFQLAREISPYHESYVLGNAISLLPLFKFEHHEMAMIINSLEERLHYLVDVFPFYFTLRPLSEMMFSDNSNLALLATYLRIQLSRLDSVNLSAQESLITLSTNKLLYFSYEATLRGWLNSTEEKHQMKPLRKRLMQSLMKHKGWQFSDLNRHLTMQNTMMRHSDAGWILPYGDLAIPENSSGFNIYSDISGAMFDRRSGKLSFSMEQWQRGAPEYLKLFTLFEVYQTFQKNAATPFFSLDPVDEHMAFHPFNKMRFAPSSLLNSALLHTMLFADYILKFLTTGAEVQTKPPYDMRSIGELKQNLPRAIQETINEFHSSQHDQSVHRFWIEPKPPRVAAKIKQLGDDVKDIFALDDLEMVIKTHKMERDVQGNLIDSSDKNEGWYVYRLDAQQFESRKQHHQSWQLPALIFYTASQEIYLIQSEGASPIILNYQNITGPISQLVNAGYDFGGELIVSDENRLLRYKATRLIAEKAGVDHHFSPEYIFAQEMTQHYEALAKSFPVFMRLKALCRMSILVRLLNGTYKSVQSEISQLTSKLNDSSFWQNALKQVRRELEQQRPTKSSLKEKVLEQLRPQAQKWRNHLQYSSLVEEQKYRLAKIYQGIQATQISLQSPEVVQAVTQAINQMQAQVTASYGYAAWSEVANECQRNIAIKFGEDARAAARSSLESAREQLESAFDSALCLRSDRHQIINDFIRTGQNQPLADLLADEEIYKNINSICKSFPFSVNTADVRSIIDGNNSESVLLHIADKAADKELRDFDAEIEKVYQREKAKVDKQKETMRKTLNEREQALSSLRSMGVDGHVDTRTYQGSDYAAWVPASIHQPSEQRLVYGGVNLAGDLTILDKDTQGQRDLISQSWPNEASSTVYYSAGSNRQSRKRSQKKPVVIDGNQIGQVGRELKGISTITGLYVREKEGKGSEVSSPTLDGQGIQKKSTLTEEKSATCHGAPSWFFVSARSRETGGSKQDTYNNQKKKPTRESSKTSRANLDQDERSKGSGLRPLDEGYIAEEQGLFQSQRSVRKESPHMEISASLFGDGVSLSKLKISAGTELKTLIDKHYRASEIVSKNSKPRYSRGHAGTTALDDSQHHYDAVMEFVSDQMQRHSSGLIKGHAFSFVKTSLWLIAHDDDWFRKMMSTRDRDALRRLLNATIHKGSADRHFPQIRVGDYLRAIFVATGQQAKLATLEQHFGQAIQFFFRENASPSQQQHSLGHNGSLKKAVADALDDYERNSWRRSKTSASYFNTLRARVKNYHRNHLGLITDLNDLMARQDINEQPNNLRKKLWAAWLSGLKELANNAGQLEAFVEQYEGQLDYCIYPISRQTQHPWSRMTIGEFLLESVDKRQHPECEDLLAFYGITRKETLLNDLGYHLENHSKLQQRIMKIDAYLVMSEKDKANNPLRKQSKQVPKTKHDKQFSTEQRMARARGAHYQEHHIIPQQLIDHPLLELAGFSIYSRANRIFLPEVHEEHETRKEAKSMSAQERAKLPPGERRAYHYGNHDGAVIRKIMASMDAIVDAGREFKFTKTQYFDDLKILINRYRQELKQGTLALNKHHRDWAVRPKNEGMR